MQLDNSPLNQKELHHFLGRKTFTEFHSFSETGKKQSTAGSLHDSTSLTSNREEMALNSESYSFEGNCFYSPACYASPFNQSMFSTHNQQDLQLEIEENDLASLWDSPFKMEENKEEAGQAINFPFISKEFESNSKETWVSSLHASEKPKPQIKPQPQCPPAKPTKFLVFQRGKKKVIKPKKINKAIPPQFKCNHCNCCTSFYTPYQQMTHHHKMTPLCTNDSILLIKLLSKTKKLLMSSDCHKTQDNLLLLTVKEKYAVLYKSVTLKNHFQYILGNVFEECVTEDDDDDEEEKACSVDKQH